MSPCRRHRIPKFIAIVILTVGMSRLQGSIPQHSSTELRYYDPTYRISFRYPRAYTLKTGDSIDQGKGLGFLGPIPIEFAAPGGVRVATVEAPKDSYPGTDLADAFFTVSVNRRLTANQCQQFTSIGKAGLVNIYGIAFRSLEEEGAATGHQFRGTYYHGFSNQICYEAGYGVATGGWGAVDGMTHVDENALFDTLRKILTSLTFPSPTSAHHSQ